MQIYVIVSLQVEGFHAWPEAPEEVGFLRHRHRHIFHIEVYKEATHADRDVEIILLKRAVRQYLLVEFNAPGRPLAVCEFGSMSCEQIAIKLMEKFSLAACAVKEDGENGAHVEI